MQLLIDTDAFCKLAIGGVLNDAVRLLGADLGTCGRLPALPYMLRRGGLRARYGPQACDALMPIVDTMPIVELSSSLYLDQLAAIPEIDPGEAQLFAKMEAADFHLITGDKRALRALKNVAGLTDVLAGRIVVLESMLQALCADLGLEEVRQRTHVLRGLDSITQICFSECNDDPMDCLTSYFCRFAEEVRPLTLWHPHMTGSV